MKTKNKKQKLVSVVQYAKLCGFNNSQVIYMREKRGKISFVVDYHRGRKIYLIDLAAFPPLPRQKVGKKAYPN